MSQYQRRCKECIASGRTWYGYRDDVTPPSPTESSLIARDPNAAEPLRAEAKPFVPGSMYKENKENGNAITIPENPWTCDVDEFGDFLDDDVDGNMPTTIPPLKQYACLVEGCNQMFGKWGDCIKHMKLSDGDEMHPYLGPKPKLHLSQNKAQTIIASNPNLQALKCAIDSLPQPWKNVSEEELVALIRPYYARDDISHLWKRRNVLRDVVWPKYGHFPFRKFGHGSINKFLERNGIEEEGHREALKLEYRGPKKSKAKAKAKKNAKKK